MTPSLPPTGPAPTAVGPTAVGQSAVGPTAAGAVVLRLEHAGLSFGDRTLWSGVDLEVRAGEFVAVLGANGSGKTTLIRVILGLQELTSGTLTVDGRAPRRGSELIGYIPQERRIAPLMPIRARDLVGMGIDGPRWGPGRPSRDRRGRVEAILESVGALHLADRPVHLLSGGEQQRIRIAQSLVTDPTILLCDEPLLSLDLNHQQASVALIDERRQTHGTAVLFVTHEINPVLPYVDRVLYLAGGRFRVGTVDEVMTSEVLSVLYDSPVEVIRTASRILVAGIPDTQHEHETMAR